MTPDRNDQTPDDTENGVLAETGAIDTTGFGIVGGATEQVSVELPSGGGDEDLYDDDVTGDEVSVFEILGVDESVAMIDIATYTGEVEVETPDPYDTGSSAASDLGQNGSASLEVDSNDDLAEVPADAGAGDAHVEAAVVDEFDDVQSPADVTEPTVEAEIVTEQHTPGEHDDWTDDAPAAPTGGVAAASVVADAVPTTTGSNPTTRREAHAESFERTHAVERVQPRSDVTLASKRLGEFEPGRESADLLTADRLLDPHQIVRPEPEGTWQHFVYSITGHRVNLGDGKRARARKALDRRISAPLGVGARFVPVMSRKGGVGKTTITTLLGMALADARDDRVIAVDANPDRGTLAERIARQNGKTVRDLVRAKGEIVGYAGISSIVARDDTRLDVLASDADPRVSEAFSDHDYHDVAAIAAHYYSIVLTDTGTGIVHSVMQATLELADQLVIVSGLSVEEARLASETLTWLETNGFGEQVRGAVVVLNNARPGTPLVRLDELETHFNTRVRSVVRMPYDPLIGAGSAITFRDLRPETRLAARELAANVVEGLRALAPAA